MFHDVRLPKNIELQAQGGPGFKTNIIELTSGREKRNITWSRTRGRWSIAYPLREKADQEAVLSFFYARRGKAYGFRFRDWTDFHIGDPSGNVPGSIGEGDGTLTKFQMRRVYKDDFSVFIRPITRPVASSLKLFLGDKPVYAGFRLIPGGIIQFDKAPGPGVKIFASAEFDVPVRFDTDELQLTAFKENLYSIPSISLVEIKEYFSPLKLSSAELPAELPNPD